MKKYQTIYYLDADNDDLYFFKKIIENLGHKISIYSDGNVMLYDLMTLSTKPDILFLSNLVPIMGDQELIQIIKNNGEWNQIPMVIVSRVFQKKLLQQYREFGVSFIMKRPIRSNYIKAYGQVLQMDLSEPLKCTSDIAYLYSKE